MSENHLDIQDEHTIQQVDIGNNTLVNMKTVQNLYNKMTGKTEKLSKIFTDNQIVHLADLVDLDVKINQTFEQYNIISKNSAVTIYHTDDHKEQFSSFERFKLYNVGSMCPCENVNLTYDFLIVLPGTKEVQSYKIIINLHSGMAIRLKAEGDETDPMGRQIIYMLGQASGNVSVDYVDYVVAKNFLFIIEEWYGGLTKSPHSKALLWLQGKSQHFPFLFRITTTILILFIVGMNSETMLTQTPNLQRLFLVSLITFGSLSIMSLVAEKIGRFAEHSLDALQPASSLRINKGDEKTSEKYSNRNRKSFRKVLLSLAEITVVNILNTIILIKLGLTS